MKKSIGILGGMGPLATADLLRKIVLLTKAEKDGEHIRIYIDPTARRLFCPAAKAHCRRCAIH